MPRGPKKSSANHRHENGIVAPGRRITRQKSNGQLQLQQQNATSAAITTAATSTSDGSSGANTPPVPSPPPGLQAAEQHQLALPGPSSNGRLGLPRQGHSSSASQHPPGVPSSVGDGNAEEMATLEGAKGGAGRSGDAGGRRAAAEASSTKQGGFAEGTVLRTRALTDTVAILIILLSLPRKLHSFVNFAFAITTFVPPAGSFNSLPTWSDFVSSYSPTTPSFVVTCFFNCVAWLVWTFLPNTFQALVIELAQAIVATTLGGGYSNKPNGPDNTLACLGFATCYFFITLYKRSICRILHRTWITRWTPDLAIIEQRSLSQDYPVGYERGWVDTFTIGIALHIFCQGLTKMVRKSLYTSRTSSTSSALSGRGIELEIATTGGGGGGGGGIGGSVGGGGAGGGGGASGNDVGEGAHHTTHQSQLRSKESLAGLRDVNRDKLSSGKRRRKQGNFVRGQQPLWAALAATKATFLREYENGAAKDDGKRSGATDAENLGDAMFNKTKNTVWITNIQPNSITFQTGAMDPSKKHSRKQHEEGEQGNVDRSKPLYVRVNGTDWMSTKLVPDPDSEDKSRPQWTGEVYGLSPAYRYHIYFVRSDNDTSLHYENVVTPPAAEQTSDAASPTTEVPPPSSPTSPTATLKASIAAYSSAIDETNEKLKKARKDNKTTQANLRKDIDNYKDKIEKQASNVQTLQVKHTRENQHKLQAEEAINTMTEEIDNVKDIPEDELKEYQAQKVEYEQARTKAKEARNELNRVRDETVKATREHTTDISSLKTKNERAQQRVERLKAQHAKLTDPDAANAPVPTGPAAMETQRSNSGNALTPAQQRQFRYAQWNAALEHRKRLLHSVMNQLRVTEDQNANLDSQLHAVRAASAAVAMEQQQQQQHHRSPSPEGDLPGTIPQPPPASSAGPQRLFEFPTTANPFSTPERFPSSQAPTTSGPFDFSPGPASLHKTNSTGGHGKTITKPHSTSIGAGGGGGGVGVGSTTAATGRQRSTSIMSGYTVYQDFDDHSAGGTDATLAWEQLPNAPLVGPFGSKRRSAAGSIGLVREGSNGGSSGSGSPRVPTGSGLGGARRPTPPGREMQWHAA